MSMNEISMEIPSDYISKIFGQFDVHIKKIERTLGVTVVVRDDQLKIIGNEATCNDAKEVFSCPYSKTSSGPNGSEDVLFYSTCRVCVFGSTCA